MPERPFQSRPFTRDFYARSPLDVAPELLGAYLVRDLPGATLAARIVEVEAYRGEDDPASHARIGARGRAAIMFETPGVWYVYFTYGMHHCVNAVAHGKTGAGAVLLRGAEPVLGIHQMRKHRGEHHETMSLARGPACLARAFAMTRNENGFDAIRGEIRIHPGRGGPPESIIASPRIGITRGTNLPWRFHLAGSPAVSRPPKRPK